MHLGQLHPQGCRVIGRQSWISGGEVYLPLMISERSPERNHAAFFDEPQEDQTHAVSPCVVQRSVGAITQCNSFFAAFRQSKVA